MLIGCDKVEGINLFRGICDLELPLPVRMGAKFAIEDGINSYTRYTSILYMMGGSIFLRHLYPG